MRRIEIILPTRPYSPGELVEGTLRLICRRRLPCNSINIRVIGKETSRVVRGHGEHRTVYKETEYPLKVKMQLEKDRTFQPGEYEFPFSFMLPPRIPGSYEGKHGRIRYRIEARIRRSWARDLRAASAIRVNHMISYDEPRMISAKIMHRGRPAFVFEGEFDVLQANTKFRALFTMKDILTFRGVRIQIIRREYVSPRGRSGKKDTLLLSKHIEKESIGLSSWNEISLFVPPDWIAAFKAKLIEVSYFMKVVMIRRWWFDKEVTIPLRFLPCSESPEFK